MERNKEIERLFETACDALDGGEYEYSLELFQYLWDKHPGEFEHANLQLWIGTCYFHLHQWLDAANSLQQTFDKLNKSTSAKAFLQTTEMLGECHWRLGNHSRAIGIFLEGEAFIDHYETYPDNLYNFRLRKGQTLIELGRYREAIEELQKCIEITARVSYPDNYSRLAKFLLGKSYLYQGDSQQAGPLLTGLEANQLHLSFHEEYHLVLLYYRVAVEQWPEALQHVDYLFRKGAPELNSSAFYNAAGRAYFHLGRDAEARQCFEASLKHPPNAEWLPENNKRYLELLARRN